MYIFGKYQIYLFVLYKQVEKSSFSGQFVLKRSEASVILIIFKVLLLFQVCELLPFLTVHSTHNQVTDTLLKVNH